MKRLVIIISILLVTAISALAQQWVEVVYLKNGSVIRGVVIEQTPGESLKIQTADGSLFVYEIEMVERIVKEQVPDTRPGQYKPKTSLQQKIEIKQYAGRAKEGRLLLDLGGGPAFSDMVAKTDQMIAEKEFADLVRSSAPLLWSLHVGGVYERYFYKKGPWFFDIGVYGGWQQLGFDWNGKGSFYQGKRITSGRYNLWDVYGAAGIGFQTSPGVEGMHFYVKAGAGIDYISIGKCVAKVYNPETGELYSRQELSPSQVTDDPEVLTATLFRPYAEVGFGNDSFFRMGIRWSPILINNRIDCVTMTIHIPLT